MASRRFHSAGSDSLREGEEEVGSVVGVGMMWSRTS